MATAPIANAAQPGLSLLIRVSWTSPCSFSSWLGVPVESIPVHKLFILSRHGLWRSCSLWLLYPPQHSDGKSSSPLCNGHMPKCMKSLPGPKAAEARGDNLQTVGCLSIPALRKPVGPEISQTLEADDRSKNREAKLLRWFRPPSRTWKLKHCPEAGLW